MYDLKVLTGLTLGRALSIISSLAAQAVRSEFFAMSSTLEFLNSKSETPHFGTLIERAKEAVKEPMNAEPSSPGSEMREPRTVKKQL